MINRFSLSLLLFLCAFSFGFGQTTIAIQDFDGTSPEWTYSSNPVPNSASCVSSDDVWNVVSNLGNITIPNTSGDFWGGQDLNGASGCGTSGIGTLDFTAVNVSGYNNVVISFDYEVDGFNGSADELRYIVTFDSTCSNRSLYM